MIGFRSMGRLALVAVLMVAALWWGDSAGAVFVSPHLLFAGSAGREVDSTEHTLYSGLAPELEDVCSVALGDTCQAGKSSAVPGGFSFPEGVATGPEPASYVYVAEEGNNRADVLSPTGIFLTMFGWHVNATKTAEFEEAGNPHKIGEEEQNVCSRQERQAVSVDATAGTFTLTLSGQTTTPINYNATSTELQAALEALSNVGAGNVAVTGGPGGAGGTSPYLATFGGSTVPPVGEPLMTSDPSGLTAGNKKVRVEYRADCRAGQSEPGGAAGVVAKPSSVAVDPATGDIYLWEFGGNRIEEYEASGKFVSMIGGGVISGGAKGTGTLTEGSASVASAVTTSKMFLPGQTITGPGIPAGTKIKNVGASSLTLSQSVASGTGTVTEAALSVAEGSGNIPANSKQSVTVAGAPTGGTFTLGFTNPNPGGSTEATAGIAPGATASEVQAALEGLANIGPGNVAVTGSVGGPWTVEFKGARYADTKVAKLTGNGAGLTPSGSVTVAVTQEGHGAGEVCVVASSCQIGVASLPKSAMPQVFKSNRLGNILAFGGPKDLLYVGDEERVAELEPNGKWIGEIQVGSLGSGGKVKALSVDPSGDVYFVYSQGGSGIHEYKASTGTIVAPPGELASITGVTALNLDAFGRLAVITTSPSRHGVLLDATSGNKVGEFLSTVAMKSTEDLAFNAKGELYAADWGNQAIEMFAPATVAELITGNAENITRASATLTGSVNPNNVSKTEAWFEWGTTQTFGSVTAREPFAGSTLQAITASLTSLLPNQKYYYRLAAEDANNEAPEPPIVGPTLSFTTLPVAPSASMAPEVSFMTGESAVIKGRVNPENAATEYAFEYGLCPPEPCSGCLETKRCLNVETTPVMSSGEFGDVAFTQEVIGLKPSRAYSVRVIATNEHGQKATSPESEFMTAPPVQVQAVTGSASAVGATSAVISGSVDPGGQPATYEFELGVYKGAGTSYGTVLSGSTGEGTAMVLEQLQLSGLQPGTTYAYKIAIKSGYGEAEGAPATFTTEGLPAVLAPPPLLGQLPLPALHFPTPEKPLKRCKPGFRRNKHGKCVRRKKGKPHGKAGRRRGRPRGKSGRRR